MSPINTGRIGHCCESAFEEKVGKSGSANGGSLSILPSPNKPNQTLDPSDIRALRALFP